MAKPLRVLIVEDSEDDALLIVRHLGKGGFDVRYERLETGSDMDMALRDRPWDVIICDYKLPKFSLSNALKIAKDSGLDLPFIVVSGMMGEERAAELMRLGVHDLILKDNLSRLVPAIERELKEAEVRRERREAERLLEMERDMLHNLMANIPDSIYFKDLEHRYVRLNEAEARILNIGSPEDALGKRLEEFLPPERAKLREEEEDKIFASGLPLIGRDEKVPQADGSVRWYSASNAPIRNRQGEIVGLVGITRDITEHMESNQRLCHLEKMDALGNLAGGIAHDFNNMLLPIMGLTKLVLKGLPEQSHDRQKLEKVIQASERAKRLVSQILAFSRQGGIKSEKFDAYEVTCETLGLLQSMLPSTIEIKVVLDENAGLIYGDAAQIETVILNLATNAADAMGGKPGVLEITVSRVDVDQDNAARVPGLREGSYVRIEVRDTGSGMNDETMNKLFNPYYTTKACGKGTGLGLAMVYGILSKHDGAIDVSSKLGVGTTFKLYFPTISGREVHQRVSLAQGT